MWKSHLIIHSFSARVLVFTNILLVLIKWYFFNMIFLTEVLWNQKQIQTSGKHYWITSIFIKRVKSTNSTEKKKNRQWSLLSEAIVFLEFSEIFSIDMKLRVDNYINIHSMATFCRSLAYIWKKHGLKRIALIITNTCKFPTIPTLLKWIFHTCNREMLVMQ